VDYLYVGIVALVVLGVIVGWGSKNAEHEAIERDLERRGCRPLHVEHLPHRHGILVRPRIGFSHGATEEANVYRVTYQNREGKTLVAVCQMGENVSVHWTDEHREPGFDRFGNPQNLSQYGTEWRG
jgi:hypothetical protein